MMPDRNDNSNSENTVDSNPDIFGESNRLDWLAFCYVADELTDAQRVDFETQLSSDIDAQEALANAVALGRSVFEIQRPMQPAADVHAQLPHAVMPKLRSQSHSSTAKELVPSSQSGWKYWIAAASVIAIASLIAFSATSSESKPVVAVHRNVDNDLDAVNLQTDGDAIESIDLWLTDLVYFDMPAKRNEAVTTDDWDAADDFSDEVAFQDDESVDLDVSLVTFYSDVLGGSDIDDVENRNGVEL